MVQPWDDVYKKTTDIRIDVFTLTYGQSEMGLLISETHAYCK
ncbi:MAG TPA: hypothetical protein VK543_16380 [Puia sp.]|nr:hypothetical protein [Puia sp.]